MKQDKAMFNWIRKLFANERADDASEKSMTDLLLSMEQKHQTVKFQAAEAIHEERRIADECSAQKRKAMDAHNAAAQAMRAGLEASARRHLERWQHAQELADAYEEQRAGVAEKVESLKEASETYKLEIERIKGEQRAWELRRSTARIRSDLSEATRSPEIGVARELIERQKEIARREEARAEVRAAVDKKDLKIGIQNVKVENEMEKLRQRLGKTRKTTDS